MVLLIIDPMGTTLITDGNTDLPENRFHQRAFFQCIKEQLHLV